MMIDIPTLEDVFRVLNREVCINIEVKTPRNDALKPNYDYTNLISVMHEKLQGGYNVGTEFEGKEALRAGNYCFISSFDHGFIHKYREYEANQGTQEKWKIPFIFIAIRAKEDVLPPAEVTSQWGKGFSIETRVINEDVVKRAHSNNQIVIAWVDRAFSETESDKMWKPFNQFVTNV